MRKLIDNGKKLWQQHFHQIAPAIKLTSKCAEYLAEFNQLLKTPSIPNYVNVGFKIKSAYDEAFKDSQHFFLTSGWKRFASQDLELMVPQLALEFYPQNIRIVGAENQTSRIHIVDLGEIKFGWYGGFDIVEACYCYGEKSKLYELIAQKVWEKKNCISLNLKKKGYYNYFVMEEEKLHDNFIISSSAQKYYEYVREYQNRKMGKSFLFYGKPGLGKSVCIKSIIHLLQLKTLRIQQLDRMNNSSIVELIDMFSPDAIVLEDIDHLYSHDISTLLEKIENFNAAGKYIFASANEINSVHDALLRPGRFDELIELPLDYEMVKKEIPDPEIYEMVKDFPIAFVMEVKKRLEIKGKERLMAEGISDIVARVDKINAGNFKLEGKKEPEGQLKATT